MQLRRRAGLVVALVLLASASAASAECTWVLWTQAVDARTRVTRGDWNPVAGYNSRQECAVAADRFNQDLAAWPSSITANTACLPDTVDPRGPKAK